MKPEYLPVPTLGSKDDIELYKQAAHIDYSNAIDAEDKALCRNRVMRAHFERSYNFREKRGRPHPLFEEYARHWVAANVKWEEPEVFQILCEWYPPVDKSMVHNSYWDPEGLIVASPRREIAISMTTLGG